MFTILGADGKEYGPVPAAKIHEWINGGRANRQTKARRADETVWLTLGDFPEFAAPAPMDAPPVPTAAASAGPTLALGGAADALPTAGLAPATRVSRLLAQIIDGLIACGVALPGFGLMLAAGFISRPNNPNPMLMLAGVGVLCLAMLVLIVFQVYLLSTVGQTIGKKVMKIRIVAFETEANPGFVKAFLLRAFVNGLIGAIPMVGGLYSLVDICFIFRDDQRCIHDLIAGTKVVQA